MGPGKTFQQERATLAAHHEALEIDLWGKGIDLLDYYRGTLTWRRLSLWIRHFWADPSSALFAELKQTVAPPAPEGALDGTTVYQQMQMLEWTPEQELLLGLANEVRSVLDGMFQVAAAKAKRPAPKIPAKVRPWERPETVAASATPEQLDAYQSPEARAARAAVTGNPT